MEDRLYVPEGKVYAPLVPQVDQPNKKELDEITKSFEEENGSNFREEIKEQEDCINYIKATNINGIILKLWEFSEVIQKANLNIPYCILSNESLDINVSWGLDDKLGRGNTRSCFYTINNEGEMKCREYPKEEIKSSSELDLVNLSITIISDLLQSWEWDWEQSGIRLGEFLQNYKKEMKGSS